MKLSRLSLQNFRQHRQSVVDFDLGLTGIIGPNGAGKSTILEAIAWALYGNPAARGTRDGIRFHKAQPRATVKVELDFDLGGHSYRIVRGLTTAELFLDGGSEPIANSISTVAEMVHRRLAMTRAEFFNTYFTGQNELNVMAAMKPSERAQFLSRVLGYEKLRTAQELIRDRRRIITAETAGIRSAMRDPESVARLVADARARCAETSRRAEEHERQRNALERNLAELSPRWEEVQRERDRLQEALAQLRVMESQEVGFRRDIERLDRELGEVATARLELDELVSQLAPLDSIAAEFQRLESLAREEGRRTALQNSLGVMEEELARLRERYGRVESAPALEEEVTIALEEARAKLEEAEGLLEARRTEWVRDRQEAETKRQTLRTQYSDLREQRERLVSLGEEGACPTCMRPLGESFRTVIDMLDSQMETVRVDGNYFKSRLDQLEEMPEDVRLLDEQRRALFNDVGNLERRLANVQHAVFEKQQLVRELSAKEARYGSTREEIGSIPAGYDERRHREVRAEIDRLAQIESRAARLSALIEKLPQLEEQRRQAEASLLELETALARLREQREKFSLLEKEYLMLRTAHEFAASQLHQAEVAAASAQSESAAAAALLDAAEREREDLERSERQLKTLLLQRRMHDELDRAFSDLRTDLNFQLRPELSELASGFMRDLTDGRYSELELDDEYRIIVLEDGVPKPIISGGEEDLANLSLRLAISQMIAERSGQAFSLLVLDEVFGSLDETRRRNVIELLRGVRDRFEQVILITHIESVKEGLDHVISVEYDENTGAAVVENLDVPLSGFYGESDEGPSAGASLALSGGGSG